MTAMNKNNDHYNLDGIYELTMLSSVILHGIAEAANKCEKYQGNPLCVAPNQIRQNQIKQSVGGAKEKEEEEELLKQTIRQQVNEILEQQRAKQTPANLAQQVVEQVAENVNPGANKKSAILGKFMNVVRTINGKIFNVIGNASKKALEAFGFKRASSNEEMEKNITSFLQQNKTLIKKMTRDPQVQLALREWIEEVGIINIQLIDMAKPTIDRLVNKILQTMNSIADKSTRGIISTSLNVLEALIGEIPIAGGIIALIIAFLRGFNTAMLAAAPSVEFSSEVFFSAVKSAFSTVNIFKKAGSALTQASLNVKGAVANLGSPIENENESARAIESARANESARASNIDINKVGEAGVLAGETYTTLMAKKSEEENEEEAADIEGEPLEKIGGGKRREIIRKRIRHVTRRLQNTLRSFWNNKPNHIIYKNLKRTRKYKK